MLAVVKHPGRNKMEYVLLVPYDHGVPRVRAALKADDYVRLLGKEIDDLALAFIAPLGANEYCVHDCRILYHNFASHLAVSPLSRKIRDKVDLLRRVEFFCCVKVLAYCCMSNHIHIFIFPEEARELSDGRLSLSRNITR